MGKIPRMISLAITLGVAACIDPVPALQKTSSGGMGGTGSGMGGSGGGTGGSGGGTGGAAPIAKGHEASAFVSAGLVAKNGQHWMVFTVGQPAGKQGTMKNASHRLEGGLVGAMEVAP